MSDPKGTSVRPTPLWPLPLALVASMLVLAGAIEVVFYGALLWLPKLPLLAVLASAPLLARRARRGADGTRS